MPQLPPLDGSSELELSINTLLFESPDPQKVPGSLKAWGVMPSWGPRFEHLQICLRSVHHRRPKTSPRTSVFSKGWDFIFENHNRSALGMS